ncbi:MAG: hypothetical protein FJW77_01840 [Actinobacteria bacterium]|nr:hypothetical protein [Actinomycetota bacterium]
MDPQRRRTALWYARGRALVGASLTVLPGVGAAVGLGSRSGATRAALRMVGVRDLALGLGAVAGVRGGTQAAEWTGWGAAADAVDAVALLVTPGLPKRARLIGLFAAGAAAVGLRLAWELADERAEAEAAARHAARIAEAEAEAGARAGS